MKILTDGAVTTEAGSLFHYFTTLTAKVALTLEYQLGVSAWAASSGREKKQVRINIQEACEYLEGGNQVNPKSSPLQGMKAQPLQSLFVGEVTHASYQNQLKMDDI